MKGRGARHHGPRSYFGEANIRGPEINSGGRGEVAKHSDTEFEKGAEDERGFGV